MNRAVVSRLRSASVNLALESALFASLGPHDRLLFVYTNDPCVVIGRNQNPWKECNLAMTAQKGVPILRRRSGGGSVVHDAGNVNFCVQTPRSEFSRTKHLYMLLDALPSHLQGRLRVNERNDIISWPQREKVSGSSYKIERNGSYHHATMLLQSNLDLIRSVLHRDPEVCGTVTHSRGTDSVKSPVSNASFLTPEAFVELCITGFSTLYPLSQPVEVIEEVTDEIMADAQHLASWEWSFGQTLRFGHRIGDHEFLVHKGVIEEAPTLPNLVGHEYRNLEGLVDDKTRVAIEPWAVQTMNDVTQSSTTSPTKPASSNTSPSSSSTCL